MNSFSIFTMKFSMNGKGEKKHSHKEGMGSDENIYISERVRHPKKKITRED
jgi:hypothetical protein